MCLKSAEPWVWLVNLPVLPAYFRQLDQHVDHARLERPQEVFSLLDCVGCTRMKKRRLQIGIGSLYSEGRPL